jgi:sugar phosphate isomerase/epimerase
MRTIKGPAIFLAQFAGDKAPFDTLDSIAEWAANLDYKGVQIPSWDSRLFNLEKAANSKAYCDDINGTLAKYGVVLTELSTHLQGQLIAVHPAYDIAFDGFAPAAVRGKPKSRQDWAVEQLKLAAKASANLGLNAHATFSGALAWPYLYPWPQRPAGLVEAAFDELAKRWRPILDTFDEAGVDLAYEIHPVKICMTAPALKCSSTVWAAIHAATFYSIQATSYCSSSIILPTLTFITAASKRFTPRTPSSIRPGARACTEVSSLGSIVLDGFGRWEMVKSILPASFQNLHSTTMRAGPYWSGSAASRAAIRARPKAPPSSPGISSRRRAAPLTTSPLRARTMRRTEKCSA